jgi:predicted O-methyltransferase YrrM
MGLVSPITRAIVLGDPTLVVHDEHEWSGGIPEGKWSAFNNGGVENEVGDFLYGLVRLLKPQKILETGTHHGISASYMGMALKANGNGHLDTLEFQDVNADIASKRIGDLELGQYVNIHLIDAKNWNPDKDGAFYDLLFLDTEPQTRFSELVKFFPFLNAGGFIFIHDLHPHMHQIENTDDDPTHGFGWPYGRIPQEMKNLVTGGRLRPFHFKTPRGLTGFYKVDTNDYQWGGAL